MNTISYSASLAKELESVRQKKIDKLRKSIATGRYEVKNNLLAKALVPYEHMKSTPTRLHH